MSLGYYEYWDGVTASKRIALLCENHRHYGERPVQPPTICRCEVCERLGNFYDQFVPAIRELTN